MRKLSNPTALISSLACSLLLFGIVASGCSLNTPGNVVPYIPPTYYGGTLILPFDLANLYWSPYTPRRDAEEYFHGKIFIFKDIKVTQNTLNTVSDGYVWVDVIKAYPLNPADLKKLSLDEKIDVVGVLAGPCQDFPNSLTFSGCVFLQSDTAQLPVGDSSPVQYAPKY